MKKITNKKPSGVTKRPEGSDRENIRRLQPILQILYRYILKNATSKNAQLSTI